MSEHARDVQAAAFVEAGPGDWVTDEEAQRWHQRGALVNVTDQLIHGPEDFEAERWDAERIGIPSLAEAKTALAARVDDPGAPDNDATAYDQLDPADYRGWA